MPKREFGFAPVIVVLIVLLMLTAVAAYLYISKSNPNLLPNFKKSEQEPDKEGNNSKAVVPDTWQTFKYKFGQISISYPPNWFVKTNFNISSTTQFIEFSMGKDKTVLAGDPLISLSVGMPRDNYSGVYPIAVPMEESAQDGEVGSKVLIDTPPYYTSNLNFTIPALGDKPNASYSQYQDISSVTFIKDGVAYTLSAYIYRANEQKLDPGELNSILSKMAKSIRFNKEQSSCDDPVLKPLDDFPTSFTLATVHNSDGRDTISGYGLTPTLTTDQKFNLPDYAKGNLQRIFLVNYEKSGNSFKEDENFKKSIVAIAGSLYSYPAEDQTSILNVNCPEYLTKASYYQPFVISENTSDPFNIAVFGSSSNPQELWGQAKWNAQLLKKTRSIVYIKRGDFWQKYSAKDYFVNLP
ncbi:hypothetical protein HYS93_02830 [Candidatus Daviesbacteria bacterium]|nr:hypothetical protein [Candidatus Daviesbacteria bacterium]